MSHLLYHPESEVTENTYEMMLQRVRSNDQSLRDRRMMGSKKALLPQPGKSSKSLPKHK